MSTNRRDFLKTSAAFAALGLTGARALARGEAREKLKILILGGTGFLGPHTVRRAQERGHVLTLFNRGKTNPGLFPDVEKLHGDRDGKLDALRERKWDAVVDNSGYFPTDVRASAELLAPNVGQYVFISSISAFARLGEIDLDETSPVEAITDGQLAGAEAGREIMPHYGALKALCEQAAEKAFPGRATNIRPGLIVGPGDPSDRWTYWPVRIGRGGEVLAPGSPEHTVQFIDVRDLADFIVNAIEKKRFGVYDATGPAKPLPIGKLLEACKAVTESDAKLTWVDTGFLEEQQVSAWQDMPVWLPPPPGRTDVPVVSIAKATRDGLTFRPLDDTILATLNWHAEERPTSYELRAGISPARETAVLAAWHARTSRK